MSSTQKVLGGSWISLTAQLREEAAVQMICIQMNLSWMDTLPQVIYVIHNVNIVTTSHINQTVGTFVLRFKLLLF